VTAVPLLQPDLAEGASLAERAYRELQALIVTGELAPGSLISETDLQAQLGLGRTPIREALRTLAYQRLVEVYPRRGMFVAALDPRDLSALSEVREDTEPFAARLAAERRTDEDVATIDALLRDLDALAADPDAYDAWFRSKVQEALADPRPAIPHAQVMQEARALIDGKGRA